MTDALDLDLHDTELDDEIHLLAELMVAAAESPRSLSQSDIDAILGVSGEPGPRR